MIHLAFPLLAIMTLADGEKPNLVPCFVLFFVAMLVVAALSFWASEKRANQFRQDPPVLQERDRVGDGPRQLLSDMAQPLVFHDYRSQLPMGTDRRGMMHVHVDKIEVIITNCPDPNAHRRSLGVVRDFLEDES